jgi:hypothetical protein
VVDEDLPHCPGRDAEEVAAILPAHVLLLHQAQIGLMHEGGGLERVIRTLAPHVGARRPAQLAADGGKEPLPIVWRAGPPSPEQGREVVARRRDSHGFLMEGLQRIAFPSGQQPP